ncbi:hypothetical protein MED222_06210 [Vibrio sp. MED222]|nr:hypothetical protein MED222_06210 [Vibrio sp. MED222]
MRKAILQNETHHDDQYSYQRIDEVLFRLKVSLNNIY